METIYALLIFVAVIFIVYQADHLFGTWFRHRGKQEKQEDEPIVEAQEGVSDEPLEPIIAPAELSNSATKDEMIHDLAEENARLLAEVDRLREQIAVLLDGDGSHRVE